MNPVDKVSPVGLISGDIYIQDIDVVYTKALIFYGGFPLENGITRVRAVKFTLYAHERV